MKGILIKDLLLLFSSKNRKSEILYWLFRALFALVFLALETFLFVSFLQNVKNYEGAPSTFLKLFLSLVFVLSTVLGFFQANKLFFNEEDARILNALPVSNNKRIRSKVAVLFLANYATSFLFCFPLFLSYYLLIEKSIFYLLCGLLYPLLTFFLSFGVILLLLAPMLKLIALLKRNRVVRVISFLCLLGLLFFGYYEVLVLFLHFVSANDFASLLTTEVIERIRLVVENFYVLNFLLAFLFEKNVIQGIAYLAIATTFFFVGRYLAEKWLSFFERGQRKEKENRIAPKATSPYMGLLAKEIHLLLGSDYLVSYSGLLLLMPLMLPLLLQAVNSLFQQGVYLYYATIVPSFASLCDCLLVSLFLLTVQSGYRYFLDEKESRYVIGLLPIDLRHQLWLKVASSGSLAFVSLLATHIVLLATGILSFPVAAFSFLESLVLGLTYALVSIRMEFGANKIWGLCTMYLMPLLAFGACFGLSLLLLPFYVLGLVSLALLLAYMVPWLCLSLKKQNHEMERLL